MARPDRHPLLAAAAIAGVVVLGPVGLQQAGAQSISISGPNRSIYLGSPAFPGNYSRITGHPVVHTPLPPIGINLDASRSGSYYPAVNPLYRRGEEGWYFGYPPYYGPGYRARSYGGYHSNNGVIQLDYSAQPFYWPQQYAGPPLFEVARRVDPALLDLPPNTEPGAAPQAPAQQPVDLALQAFDEEEYLVAAQILDRRHSERVAQEMRTGSSAPDRSELRGAALAYAAAGEFAEAVDRFDRAYEEQPSLKDDPLNGPGLIGSRSSMRGIVTRAVRAANAEPSPEAWRLVGYLMLCEGRPSYAERMFERASALERVLQRQNPAIPGGQSR